MGIFSFIGLCCQHKCATVTLLLIALIFSAATVGAYFRYKDHTLGDSYEFTHGYWLACALCICPLLPLWLMLHEPRARCIREPRVNGSHNHSIAPKKKTTNKNKLPLTASVVH